MKNAILIEAKTEEVLKYITGSFSRLPSVGEYISAKDDKWEYLLVVTKVSHGFTNDKLFVEYV